MEFESWWNEEGPSRLDHPPGPGTTIRQLNAQTGHGTKHTMTIFYFTMEQLFQIHIDDTPEPFTIAITRPDGSSLEPWDLYVGARLDVLGRPTTLMKASCETMTWLDRQAGLMMQRIKRLEADLAKFQPLSVRRSPQPLFFFLSPPLRFSPCRAPGSLLFPRSHRVALFFCGCS